MLVLAHYQAGVTGLPNDDKKLARIAAVTPKIWDRIKPVSVEEFSPAGSLSGQNSPSGQTICQKAIH